MDAEDRTVNMTGLLYRASTGGASAGDLGMTDHHTALSFLPLLPLLAARKTLEAHNLINH
jgi:hypothetical protein